MSTKYNVYYSVGIDGPWELANGTPIDFDSAGMSYTIPNLKTNSTYRVAIVGGEIIDGEFVSYINQPIGSAIKEAGAIGAVHVPYVIVKTFNPVKVSDDQELSQQFTVI